LPGTGGVVPAGHPIGGAHGRQHQPKVHPSGTLGRLRRKARALARFGGGGSEAPYVTVYVASSLPEAHVVAGRLESEDIPTFVRHQLSDQLWAPAMPLHGIEVQVPRALAERALALID
jgi:hypothetical protein